MSSTSSSSTITAAELVVRRLEQLGIRCAFGVVGGAIMYITDALRRAECITCVFTHHEQSAAIAAEAYAKMTNTPALVFATAGPGTTNIVTGVADAYMDSIPMVVLLGDVRSTIAADFARQRYNAPQEVNQAALMKPIVKGYMALSPEMDSSGIVAAVDELARTAVSGRPGPVCICIPLDVQATPCDAAALAEPFSGIDSHSGFVLDAIDSAMQAVLMAQRPLVLLGAGVRIAGMAMDVDALLARYHLPWCVSIGAVDLQDDSHPLSCGCVGPTSQRAANTLLRAADCVLALATSFDQSVTGFNISGLVANKRVFVVNVDPSERLRFHDPQITALDVSLADFLTRVGNRDFTTANHDAWRSEIRCVKAALTNDLEASLRTAVTENYLSAYDITLEISRHLPATATIVLGISLDAHSVFNAFRVTRGQRIIVSRNLGPMGWDLPALLGAYASTEDNRPLILITGDGSLMLNVQELAVIAGMQIPACMFVFCNDGYASIRTTQSNFFTKDFFGCNQESGLYLPALKSLALGFNIEHEVLHSVEAIAPLLRRHSAMGRPRLIECRIDPSQVREPRLVTRVDNGVFATPTLADMHPPLPADIAAYVKSVLRLKDD